LRLEFEGIINVKILETNYIHIYASERLCVTGGSMCTEILISALLNKADQVSVCGPQEHCYSQALCTFSTCLPMHFLVLPPTLSALPFQALS
jgi:hypothetical protein